jgi:hypothetical protein
VNFDIIQKFFSALPYIIIGIVFIFLGGLIINYPESVINSQLGTGITIIAFGFTIFMLGLQETQPSNKEVLKEIKELKNLLRKKK